VCLRYRVRVNPARRVHAIVLGSFDHMTSGVGRASRDHNQPDLFTEEG